jgi:Protein of unknown function (DUF4233)
MNSTRRRLGGAVLIFEAIVFVLAVPVAINVASAPAAQAWAVGLSIASFCVIVAGKADRDWAVKAGWTIQALAIASAVIVPTMALLGAMFAGLWYAALTLAADADSPPSEAVSDNAAEQPVEGR